MVKQSDVRLKPDSLPFTWEYYADGTWCLAYRGLAPLDIETTHWIKPVRPGRWRTYDGREFDGMNAAKLHVQEKVEEMLWKRV